MTAGAPQPDDTDTQGASESRSEPAEAIGQQVDNSVELRESLEDMVWQFAYRFDGGGRKPPCLGTGGLSALEWAFSVLEWPDPKPCPDSSCDIKGCQKWPGSGNPIPDGDYWHLCTDHMLELRDKGYETMTKKPGRGYGARERKERLARR